MKKILFWLIVVLMLTSLSIAQAQQKNLPSQMNDLENMELQIIAEMKVKMDEYKELQGPIKDDLVARDKEIKRQMNNLTRDKLDLDQAYSIWQRDIQALQRDKERYEQMTKEYYDYGCRPGETSTNIPFVNACNEKARTISALVDNMNARLPDLQQRKNYIEQEIARIKQLQTGEDRKKLNEETLAWAAKTKECAARFNELKGQLRVLRVRMNNVCQWACEELRHKCGNVPFDGANPYLPQLTDDDIKPGTNFFGTR
jgi:DNA repair exonuclease SbcCD ATPase subunit